MNTDHEPLAGFAVGVTAARRHEELAALLERRGARVVHAPAIRLVPLADDAELLHATNVCIADRLDYVVVTTAIGFRAWLETADGWGLRDALIERLHKARILARGPKARGAIRSAGLQEEWSPDSESCQELLRHLLAEDLTGTRIAVQLYGEPLPDFTGALRAAGAEVIEVPVYRWSRTDDSTPLRRLVGQAVAGTIDAITFTSAPAVTATLAVAAEDGLEEALLEALRTHTVAACVGPVTAQPLTDRGVPTVQPERARIGALVRALAADLPRRRARRINVRGHTLELRGHAVVLDGQLRPIAPAPMAILRALARRPGHVVSRAELCTVLPSRVITGSGWGRDGRPQADEHAVEMAVARLRRGLGRSGIVETVVKRGYRLACDPVRTDRPF
ncbi:MULTISPECIES: uroporphyrinogen-III synthase [Thermomonospora]|uniref:Uroporphyrinogen III synthase HEM4 n=1 Tax=Thermomonospora curvata (strain ATCC 19995 / DSM 43183 / JCM 3096 / KCTC 9072 / NBRC 15933 / NCIMB 10081 / Henssen B9) TaxID=471852 RepID=D1A3S0_THECD|nr:MULTISPECIES: uroporphyrinogen-III synthase [Thermomonospora]ACY97973.1 Uroporphyrinogen III synthase HEM4 [Thermomonospora curvata DSM 43183]PKK14252.1 MAG: uroporphyrinogen-III synthase [Thermomonospora sp. CIF 1]